MAAPSLKGAKPKARYAREKLNIGKHVCTVRDVRWHEGHNGKGFFIDFEVADDNQPSPKGQQGAIMVYPDNARAQGRMTREMAYAAELGKMQVSLAAVYGLQPSEAEKIDDTVFQASIARPISPLRGARIIVDCRPHTKADGTVTSFYEVEPHPQGNGLGQAELPEAGPAPTFEEAAAAAGWMVHPDSADYMFNELPEHSSDPVKTVVDLKVVFGY